MNLTELFIKSMNNMKGEGKKVFDYDIYDCPEELKGQLKLGEFFR